MPELNPYNSQVESQGPVGGVSPNLEAVSAYGRGVEKLGNDISQSSELIDQRTAQAETSDGYAQMAQLREKKTLELKKGLESGDPNFDVDTFKQQYADDAQKIGDSMWTAQGKDYFNRRQARDSAALTQMAAQVSGQLKKKQAIDDFQQGTIADSNTAYNSPGDFGDLIDEKHELAKAYVYGGNIGAGDAQKMISEAATKIAMGAAKGLADQDPGYGPDGVTPVQNKLLQMLNTRDENGKNPFDDYLTAEQQAGLEKYAATSDKAREAGVEQSRKLKKEAVKDSGDAFELSILPDLAANRLKPQTVLDNRALLGPDRTYQLLERIKQQAKEPTKTNDPTYISLAKGINADDGSPNKINSTKPIWDAVANKQLSIEHADKLIQDFNRTKGQKDLNVEKQKADAAAETAIRFKDMTAPGAVQPWSSIGDKNFAAYLKEKHSMEEAAANDTTGIKQKSLYDPANKEGVYNLMEKYRTSFQDQMSGHAKLINQEGIKKAPVPKLLPGESLSDFDKRTGVK
jgi:hypothetical protein